MKTDRLLKIVLAVIGVFILAVAVSIFLDSLTDASYDSHIQNVLAMDQTSTYENDPNYGGLVSGIRTGVKRDLESLLYGEYECTDDGAYFSTSGFKCFYLPLNSAETIA